MSITLINAGPGTGKTFTIHYGYRMFSNQMIGKIDATDEQQEIFDYLCSEFKSNMTTCFFAHSNTTKDNLVKRLPKKTPVYTFHGAGQSSLIRRYRFQQRDYLRTEKLISDITGQYLRDMKPGDKFTWLAVKRFVHYLKLENMQPTEENFQYIKLKYPDMSIYQFPTDWQNKSIQLLDKCSIINGFVEFDDMLWLGMRSVVQPRFDVGFVDESQDISACAYALVTRLCRHVVFCGDKNQAINAFAGASEEMYDKVAQVSDAILPLKMTLRCPPFICDMANHIRPRGVIKGPNEGPGEHHTIEYSSLPGKLQELRVRDTMIISRTNAALISCAIMLHAKNVPAKIIDRELADEVKNFFKGFHTQDFKALRRKIQEYEDRGMRSKNTLWVQMVSDKCRYARALLDAVKTYTELETLIEETFEKHPDGYSLCSIHKAKGLEARNIFILNPPIELECAMSHPIARDQEINCHFVALTRSAMNLTWVK